ncbi:MAG: PH domain-containing protein [Anaerolineae bacterium]
MENTWEASVRTGWIVGLALAVILIAATVGLVVTAVVTPLSIRVFLMGLGACLTLGLAIRVIYQLWGLINAKYELDRNALTIHWGPVQHQIPMGSVHEVLSGAKLDNLHIRPSLRWPGYMVALGRAKRPKEQDEQAEEEAASIDPILFYATKRPKYQVVIRTEGIAYAISPADTEGFLVALRERLEMGPTQEVEEQSRHPAFLDWPIWKDRWALGMLIASLASLVLLVGVLSWRYPYLPSEIALRFTPDGAPLLVGRAIRIFYFALLATGFLLIDGSLGLFFYRRERPIAYFLWSGLLATMGSLWAAVISILLMQQPQ